jgi:hypothetical protein
MALAHIETSVSQAAVRVRYSDSIDATKAKEWIDVCVKFSDLAMPSGAKVSEPEAHSLAGLRLTALLHVRAELNAEIQRLAQIANRNS